MARFALDEIAGTLKTPQEDRHRRARKLGSSALLWQSSTLLSAVTSILLMLVIARVRGPEWFGDLSTYIFISGVGATIGAVGIPNSLAKYVSELGGHSGTLAPGAEPERDCTSSTAKKGPDWQEEA